MVLIIGLLLFDAVTVTGIYFLIKKGRDYTPEDKNKPLTTFSSCAELAQVFEKYQKEYIQGNVYFDLMGGIRQGVTMKADGLGGGAEETSYSTTNIQVEGVDEADIVKTDGEYIYGLKENTREVVIVKAYPVEEARLVSRITFEDNETPQEMFVDGNNLMIIGYKYDSDGGEITPLLNKSIYPYHTSLSFVKIYSVFNHEKPQLRRDLEFQGSYQTSRKIDDYAYLVINDYKYWSEEMRNKPELLLPQYQEDGELKSLCSCNEVKTVLPFEYPNYLNIISISISDYSEAIQKEVTLGGSDNVYASLKNLYVANTTYERDNSILEEMFDYIWPTKEITTVYKFNLDQGKISYDIKGLVDGRVLNQFSMDEFEDHFRIATTEGHVNQMGGGSSNNVYVLDQDLNIVGAVENMAPGEQIYSARFMGKKGYVVTFKKVDPFFTLDLSNPKNPKVLGKLKIPGYSDYLHPLDENHILGLGKNTVEAQEGGFAWYQGIKMAIFDVSDFANPKELYKTEIGDRGTDSYALHDHKAFLYDRERELLVIPVALAEIPEQQKSQTEEPNTYGTFTFQGAYVYKVNLKDGFKLKGRVTHYDDGFNEDRYYYYYGDEKSVKRALYIEDNLYTISGEIIKVNDLDDLKEIKKVEL